MMSGAGQLCTLAMFLYENDEEKTGFCFCQNDDEQWTHSCFLCRNAPPLTLSTHCTLYYREVFKTKVHAVIEVSQLDPNFVAPKLICAIASSKFVSFIEREKICPLGNPRPKT